LTFGYGAHACVAAHLARLEAKIALEELTQHWKSFQVDIDALHRSRTATVGGFDHVPISVEWADAPISV
jgi:cytochrome P450